MPASRCPLPFVLAPLFVLLASGVVLADPACVPFQVQAVLDDDNATEQYNFGYAVAVEGDTIAIGVPLADPEGLADAGAVHVYVRSGSSWTLQALLTASDMQGQSEFGAILDLSGKRLVVGTIAREQDGIGATGTAYVFARTGSAWIQEARFVSPNPVEWGQFGAGVAIDGDTVAVSAGGETVAGIAQVGAVYVYRLGATWELEQRLSPAGSPAFTSFGSYDALALAGDTLVVGAYRTEHSGKREAGAVHVFDRSGTTWTATQLLTAPDAEAGDAFGLSVAAQGDTLVAGALSDPSPAGAPTGSAYVFTRSSGAWMLEQRLRPANVTLADRFGIDVSLDGDLLVVGHERDTRLGVNRAGTASIFARRSGHWAEEAIVMDVTPASWETFGGSVAVDGSIVVVGNPMSHVSGAQGPGTALVFHCAENPRIQPPTMRIDSRKRLPTAPPIIGHPHASLAPATDPVRRDHE